MQDRAIIIDRIASVFTSGLIAAWLLVAVALYWGTCSPTRDEKIALASSAFLFATRTASR